MEQEEPHPEEVNSVSLSMIKIYFNRNKKVAHHVISNFYFVELDSQGRLTDTDKWDNHNAIARGWKNVEDNYRPVTFRGIYGVEKQAPTPVPMMGQRTPNTSATPVASHMPSGEPEGESDL